ncbi:MAG: NifB/NifX family molybdenum-iron cluster-binding protein [Methanobacterium sp.]|nr:NifB/NifX family molybdenum-iron cluster-binding protein [Methanobacterium sp.]
MKIAIVSTGNNLDSEVSTIFGRCPYFAIVDAENGEIQASSIIDNPAMNERGGAGIKAAQLIANNNVNVLLSGAVGPNAFEILKQVGIKVYKPETGSVKDNINFFSDGKLKEVTTSSSTGAGARGRGGMERRR